MEPPRLTIFSTPLISTWVLDETHRVLFDAGDGAAALLEGKIHKIHLIALTHAHRDHIAGLLQLLNLRGGAAFASGEPLRIAFPAGSGSVIALARFLAQFDPATTGRVEWLPIQPGQILWLDETRFLRTFETRHMPLSDDPLRARCLGYQLGRLVSRLRPELRGLPQAELDRLRTERGREGITVQEEERLFTVSGDTPAIPAATLTSSRFLLHEATFLDSADDRCANPGERGHEHACLEEVLELAEQTNVERLALYHISKRYTDEEILRTVRAACARRELKARVSVVLPGRLCHDVFGQTVWPPRTHQNNE